MRASLAVVLLLLASVGTASADCAWVLWEDVYSVSTGHTFRLLSATTTEATCRAQARDHARMTEDFHRSGGSGKVHADAGAACVTVIRPQNLVHVYDYDCFPDTIDPRGPKEK